jgi:hypothetical protein
VRHEALAWCERLDALALHIGMAELTSTEQMSVNRGGSRAPPLRPLPR